MLYDGKKFRGLILFLLLPAPAAWGRPAESFEDLMNKAREAQLAGKADEAVDLYRAALRMRPHWGPAEYGLGQIATIQKNYQEAIELLSQALRDDPSLVGAYLFRGIALFNLQKPDQALPSLERFYRLRPNDPEVRFFLAGTYSALGNYSKAAEYYAAQLEVTPERTELWYFLGQCLLNMARQMKSNLVDEPGGSYRLSLLDAQAEAQKGDVAVAERGFREAIKTDPSNAEGYINLGNLFLGRGKHAEAQEQFQEALQRAPQNCRALEGLGDVRLAMGDIPASIAEYAKVAGAKDACIEEPVPVNLGLPAAEFGTRLKTLSEYAASAKWKLAAALERSRLKGHVLGAEEPGAAGAVTRQLEVNSSTEHRGTPTMPFVGPSPRVALFFWRGSLLGQLSGKPWRPSRRYQDFKSSRTQVEGRSGDCLLEFSSLCAARSKSFWRVSQTVPRILSAFRSTSRMAGTARKRCGRREGIPERDGIEWKRPDSFY